MSCPKLFKKGIGGSTLKTKSFAVPPLQVCRVSIHSKHRISHSARRILDDRSHVLYEPTRKRYAAILHGHYDERQEGLWLIITANTMQKKRVVRSWARRRIVHAVTWALRMRGFGTNGKRLVDRSPNTPIMSESNGSQNKKMQDHAPEVLIGTVEVHVLPKSIETSFAEVQRQIGMLVDQIFEKCGRYPRPAQYDPQQRPKVASYDQSQRNVTKKIKI
ncbi:hypothetical protein BDR22DRAFT_885910 [Usnea florida]